MDHRYCIDNGAMIAQAGIMALQLRRHDPDGGGDLHATVSDGSGRDGMEAGEGLEARLSSSFVAKILAQYQQQKLTGEMYIQADTSCSG